ncbi:putative LRR receptor-like serine/threonine-protein kinase [Dichanthelium oligosanthes]|uniref:Putative LRR receptor-like serine/threonine-protein kinase n=1 Tax=Dichanthelium oligosanthes TaxID=888268 RepID=A0A1E5VLV0_9POAL|nr:putative LRR receptor-like serine/threonine-protein kinase [Dichanthelium oligosanthes]
MAQARSRLLLLCLAVAATTGVLRARAQPDSIGFISIDCGLPGTASYVDDTTKLAYVPDAAFIDDAGSNHNISTEYITPTLSRRYRNVRSFPDGARHCYTLRSIVPGLKYLLRATFKYGNYDGLGQPPIFDLYIGVNFWSMANITDANSVLLLEAIVLVPDDFVQVCLVNTGSGTPFISGLDLRPLKSTLYPQANATQGLVLLGRMNFGPTNTTAIIRYPDDPHDRVWIPWVDTATWNSVSTTLRVEDTSNDDIFEVPTKVMQTAITPRNASQNIEFFWDPEPQPKDPTPGYIANMHFSELQLLPGNALRQFYINLNGKPWYPEAFTPTYLVSDSTYNSNPSRGFPHYNISINATANSTLPPMINAVEIFSVISTTNVGTDSQDGPASNSVKPQNETPMSHAAAAGGGSYPQSSLQLENRRFTYKELEMITNNFQRELGRGGFGKVYDGFLEDGTQVAVKLRSDSSNQGVKEFLAEAQTLTRIHHKNLVSMIGYCKDGEYMALVYEYMSEGALQEHISGNGSNEGFLNWKQRLRIALESAEGLEYLHKGCNPPLIHRDVKATNILLNAKLEAKIADFGLTKAYRETDTHISTSTLVGTPGYVDPECHAMLQPTTKSDVYSFGVVLLELVTGRPAILRDPEPTSLIQWARQRLARGNIEGVADPRMRGDHDVNSVWKAADIALKCTEQASAQRPTMTDVVAQLQECLELEEARAPGGGDANGGYYTGGSSSDPYSGYNAYGDGQYTDVSQISTGFEVEHNFGRVPTMPTGPAAR